MSRLYRHGGWLAVCGLLLLGFQTDDRLPAEESPMPKNNEAVVATAVAAMARNFDQVEVQEHPWGWIRWLMNDQLDPQARMTLGVVQINAGQGNPPHRHANCEEVLYVLSGSCEHRVGEQTVVLRPGDVLRVPQGVPHAARVVGDEPMRCVVVYNTGRRQFEAVE